MADRPFQTEYAQRCARVAAEFAHRVPKTLGSFKVSLTPPESSTGGGVRARQHVVITSADGRTMVIGWANVSTKSAQMRTLGFALSSIEERFGTGVSVPNAEYLALVEAVTAAFEDCALTVSAEAYAKDEG